ncbi:D-alanyl-D-alanine carboxypeptidase/D-alanyl-D-alanine endopeptidase [Actinomadura keratinilytica]|jgi:D-alanyl-D-alanine carboxypeptidase/D-alanyl-D-alanine-endopeptidase (penicillin-binding protein 4)|uniref:D-alanyl-D-alanine carboxypeptidase/D-alanyl-D-alanine-endopeptidase n=1 Tax=Actinomadura keratinilytica TaxID=547461 RepID=A0ABP7YWI0_9ACTN
MRSVPFAAAAAAVAAVTAAATPAAGAVAAGPHGLGGDIDAILADPRLAGAGVGVAVRDARTGRTLYERGADRPLVPASNQKLQTLAAALDALGPRYRFRTTVASGPRSGGRVHGDLYLKGTGDPTLLPRDYRRLAGAVAAAGIRRVEGRLVADDTHFDDRRLGDGWEADDEQYAYAAQVSALTLSPDRDLHAGAVRVDVAATRPGAPVRVALRPPTRYLTVDNRARTGRPGTRSTLSVTRPRGTTVIRVTGRYPAGGPALRRLRSVHEPALYAAAVFRAALRAHGVRVDGATVRGRTPADARPVAVRSSVPLARLAVPYMKLSNNTIAEILVKAMGRERKGVGSWPAGLSVTRRRLGRLGVDASRLTLADGSGLSRANRTTPRQLTELLLRVRGEPWFPAFARSLPVAGHPHPWVGGTLASRMRHSPAAGNVRAKTGTLTGVTALSGYVRGRGGRPLVFSIVLNGYRARSAPKDIEDRIAIRLAGGPLLSRAARTAAPQTGRECSWTAAC